MYTLYKTYGNDFKRNEYFLGDVRQCTIHSFVSLLNLYPETKLYFYPYYGCEPDTTYMEVTEIHNQSLDDVIISNIYPEYKIMMLYILPGKKRVRQYNYTRDVIVLNLKQYTRKQLVHPLPRNELHEEVDANPEHVT